MSNPTTTDIRTLVAEWLTSAQTTGECDNYHSKRKELRAAWYEPLELRVGSEILYVQAKDISESGIGLTCRRLLDIGAEVHVRRSPDDPWVHCRVVHTTETIGSYKVGIQLRFEFDE